jgi:hypothetical protein
MPKYYVYNKNTGEVVNVHETYDATSGLSLRCNREEVMSVLDETLNQEDLEILEVESESQPAVGVIRVDPNTRTLVMQEGR